MSAFYGSDRPDDCIHCRFFFRDREQRINMIHLLPDDQLVRRIIIEQSKAFRNIRIEDPVSSHEYNDIADVLQIPVDRANLTIMHVQVANPLLRRDGAA